MSGVFAGTESLSPILGEYQLWNCSKWTNWFGWSYHQFYRLKEDGRPSHCPICRKKYKEFKVIKDRREALRNIRSLIFWTLLYAVVSWGIILILGLFE